MDDIKPQRGRYDSDRAAHRSSEAARPQPKKPRKNRHSGELYFLVRSLGKAAAGQNQSLLERLKESSFAKWHRQGKFQRMYTLMVLVLFLTSTVATVVQPLLEQMPFSIPQQARGVLPEPNDRLGKLLTFDAKEAKYLYNKGYSGAVSAVKNSSGDPRFSASYAKDPSKGVTVTDPVNSIDFTMKPKFPLGIAKQDQNQMAYALGNADGYLVYTNQIASVKEDIVLTKAKKDKMVFEYELDLSNGLTAKLEKNGSVGIYGSELPLNGNVATGSEQDAALLEKARQNAPKTKFLFGIPAPFVKESGNEKSNVSTRFELEGNRLKVVAEGLKKANYPLSIDPSIFIDSAAQLMRGNNESNVEFDIANELFKKGSTTGARIDEWTDVSNMNDAVYGAGVAAASGYVYRAGGRSGSKVMPYIADQKVTTSNTASTSIVVDMPSNRPTGDLYIAIIGIPGANLPATSGWTAFSTTTGTKLGAYYRYSTSAEPATYTWTASAAQQFSAVILRIKNFDTASIVNTSSTGVNNQAGNVSMTYPSLTTNAQGTLVIAADGFQTDPVNTSGYSPSGWADVISAHSTNTRGNTAAAGIMVSTLESPPLSATPTGTQTMPAAQTGHTTGNFTSAAIAINGITSTAANNSTLQWAHINNTNASLESPTPGSTGGPCTGWCTNSAYNLPSNTGSTSDGAGIVGAAMVAYNGYLYYIGGNDASNLGTGANIKSTIYVAKLGANGEPQLWHPSDSNQANWVFWHRDTGIYSATTLQYTGAYAYNGRMYLVGGDTNTANHSGATANVRYADILPNGTLGTWSNGTDLPTAAYGVAVQGYNGYLYAIGGNNNGTILNTTYYTRLNSDGSMNAWQTAVVDGSTFTTGRAQLGGSMSGIWGGYLYLAGGCSAVDATTDYCTSLPLTAQLASINADGTLDIWNTMLGISHQRFGSSFIAWQDNLYRFGGCSRQDTSTGTCYGTHLGIQYGAINQDGDASTVSISQSFGSGDCVDPDPYNCNLPDPGTGASQAGQALSSAVVLNGYLYVIGGCTSNNCGAMSDKTYYAAIDSTGRLKSPPTCTGSTVGAWCVDSTNTITPTSGVGLGASAATVFNGTIYLVGGQNGSANPGGGPNRIFRNTVNSDGSLAGAWQSQRFNTVGLNAYDAAGLSYSFAYARANPSSASTNPGNLFLFGGCTSPAAASAGCSNTYSSSVYKCNISTSGAVSGCVTGAGNGQLDITQDTGASGAGLGIHAGTVYANYIYLIGGVAPGFQDIPKVRYAKFDNNNNVVAVSGTTWIESPVEMNHGRRRGTAFGYNGYLYAVGGYDSATTSVLDSVEFVKINVSDGSLVSSIAKPGSPGKFLFSESAVKINQRWGLALSVSNSFAYIIGGCKSGVSPTCDNNSFDNTVQTFQIYNNDSGAPGGYTPSSNLFTTDRIGASAAILNGYMYIAGGCTGGSDCSTTTNDVQMAPIGANGNVSSAWTTASIAVLPATRAWGQLESVGGTLYYLGGETGGTAQSTVYYATMGSNGTITGWTATNKGLGDTGAGAVARTQFSATVWNNRIYLTGGNDAAGAAQAKTYVTPSLVNGGDITTNWTALTDFSVARNGHTAIAYANNLYILGGYDGTNYFSDVQFAKISSNGTIGSWTYTTSLPTAIRQSDGFASNGYMYLFGGRASANECQARTLVAPISANTTIATGNNPTGIGEWYQTNRNFDGGRYGAAAVNYQGKAYVLGGGCQGIVMQDDFDPGIDSGEWTYTTGATADTICQSTSSSNTMRIIGGSGNYAATKDVNVSNGGTINFKLYIPTADVGSCLQPDAPVFGTQENIQLQYDTDDTWGNGGGTEGTIATYVENQTTWNPISRVTATIPAAAQTASTRFRWQFSTTSANGSDMFAIEDVYIIANNNNTISYPSDRVAQTSLLSQPQIANYSRLIDAGKDVTPTVWLMNGLDNSIGARWQLNYRSLNDTTNVSNPCGGSVMTTFGSNTNYGDVTLGTPGPYVVKNSGGTNIGCARYFFMTVSIDASQTYGYPEDVSRGPTLDNLALFFTSSPGQRLLHGKTFLEGMQQPLDTPCRQSGGGNNANCPLP